MGRYFVICNIAIVACLVWRVHHGGSFESAVTVSYLAVVLGNGALIIKWWLARGRPKPVALEQFPWRQWRKGNAVGIVLLVLIALQGYSAADLTFFSILAFGGGNLLTVAFWLWDKHALRRRGEPEQESSPGSR